MKRINLFYIILGIFLISGCSQATPAQPTGTSLPAPDATMPPAAPTKPSATATSVAQIPAGWATYTSQQCEYAISYPAEMQVTDENPYSRTLGFNLSDPDESARNFVYVSLVVPEIQDMVKEEIYNNEVYNYDPAEAEILLNMQIGERLSVRETMNVDSWFTYQRKPDTPIGDHAALTYENTQPWEFPPGTKEIRHILSFNGCTYLIGGYLDTTSSNQPGAITEDLFNQIVATFQLIT